MYETTGNLNTATNYFLPVLVVPSCFSVSPVLGGPPSPVPTGATAELCNYGYSWDRWKPGSVHDSHMRATAISFDVLNNRLTLHN